jgi:nucleotide-binding universal stress UspA family protein
MLTHKHYKHVVLTCSLEERGLEQAYEKLNDFNWGSETKFYFVHVFNVQIMVNDFTPFIYPDDEQKVSIREVVLKQLENIKVKYLNDTFLSAQECLFDSSPKKKLVEYLDEVNADLVMVASPLKDGIEGMFSSSMAEYLLRHASCDVMVLRR